MRKPARRPSLGRLAGVLFVILAGAHILGPAPRQTPPAAEAPEPAPPRIWPEPSFTSPAFSAIHLGGRLVEGTGQRLDLGRALPAPGRTLRDWLLGPPELILPSCLTAPPPPPIAAPPPHLPVRDDLPGFYGAPWTATAAGNLVVLLHVTAPRNPALPVPGAGVQIYRAYDGRAQTPDFSTTAPARVVRGGAAVLYRVFPGAALPGAPLRCLDLVVPAGQPAGTGYLYYQRGRHYFVATARFVIQK